MSRQYEGGCRALVALFLVYSVSAARLRFAEERLAVHSKIQIPSVQIPDVGFVGERVDFITASTVGTAEMGMNLISTFAYL